MRSAVVSSRALRHRFSVPGAIRLRHVAYVSMVALCEEDLATVGEDKLMWQENPNGAPQAQHSKRIGGPLETELLNSQRGML
jgi:hypothetical protein